MRAVIQRCTSASVTVDGKIVSSIGPGLLCLVGIKEGDTQKDVDYICKKILKTRCFAKDGNRGWEEDVTSKGYEVLLVSQFTLYGRLKKPKPDFSKAMGPSTARGFYQNFVDQVKALYDSEKVKDGVFGAMMDVALVNDGPVTFIVDSEADATN